MSRGEPQEDEPFRSFSSSGRDAAREAEENLRQIREFMERSTRHSTFSGLSGVVAGLASIGGCLVQALVINQLPLESQPTAFLLNWGFVVALALGADFLITKRRAPLVGKRIVSRLGRQMALAAAPGLGTGALLTYYFVYFGAMNRVYPIWMLTYGAAVCAVGQFSQPTVSRLGWAFLAVGALSLLLETSTRVYPGAAGLPAMAIAAGGFHIIYGIAAGRRDGWE